MRCSQSYSLYKLLARCSINALVADSYVRMNNRHAASSILYEPPVSASVGSCQTTKPTDAALCDASLRVRERVGGFCSRRRVDCCAPAATHALAHLLAACGSDTHSAIACNSGLNHLGVNKLAKLGPETLHNIRNIINQFKSHHD